MSRKSVVVGNKRSKIRSSVENNPAARPGGEENLIHPSVCVRYKSNQEFVVLVSVKVEKG